MLKRLKKIQEGMGLNRRSVGAYRYFSVILITSLTFVIIGSFEWKLAIVFRTLGLTIAGGFISFMLFDFIVRESIIDEVRSTLLDFSSSTKMLSETKAMELNRSLMGVLFKSDQLPEMVSLTISDWSRWHQGHLRNLSIIVNAEDDKSDLDYYLYDVTRTFEIPREVLSGKDFFIVRCIDVGNSFNRKQLKGENQDYSWAFARSSNEQKISDSAFDLKYFHVDDEKIEDLPKKIYRKLNGFECLDFSVPIRELVSKRNNLFVKIRLRFSVRQAKRYGFFAVSSYQPTFGFKCTFNYEKSSIDDVFVMEYFRDDDKVDLHPRTSELDKTVRLTAEGWVLPGNAAIFSWAEHKSNN